MRKKIGKITLFSLVLCFLIGVGINDNTREVKAALTQDYSNLTFNAGDTSIPSGFILSSQNPPTIVTNFSKDGYTAASVIYVANGGGTTHPYEKPNDISKSKRWLGFTLYEDVELDMGVVSGGKTFEISDSSGMVYEYTSKKWEQDYIVYQFLGIPSSGKTFYIGGSNSQMYISHMHWGEAIPKAYFDGNGGTFSDGSTRTYSIKEGGTTGDPVDAPSEPTHPEGYKFLGWASSQDSTTAVSSYVVGSTYYAIWSTQKEATSININYGTLQMNEGEGKWLDVVTVPSGASAGNLTWSSSDPTIATVDKDGYVEAVAPGTCTITVTNGTLSDTCQIVVVTTTKYTVTFQMEGYEDKQVTVYAGAKVTVPGLFQSMKGYDVQWTYNGEVFDPNVDVVKSDMTLVGKIVPNGHATEIIFQKFDADNNPVDVTANEVINIKNNNKLSFRLSRADGEPITVTEPYAWSSNDITTITVDQSGNLQALKMGRVQITLSLYAETNDNRITATIVVINPEKTDGNGNVIDTNISLIAQKGYFKATGDNERGARFIAVIPEEYLPYIYSAKMTIVATLDSNGDGEYEINQTYEVDIKTFYKTVGYQSKTPSSGELKKDWSEEGKLGAAVTINKIPYYGFSGGTLSATFVVTDKDSRLDIPAYASLSF